MENGTAAAVERGSRLALAVGLDYSLAQQLYSISVQISHKIYFRSKAICSSVFCNTFKVFAHRVDNASAARTRSSWSWSVQDESVLDIGIGIGIDICMHCSSVAPPAQRHWLVAHKVEMKMRLGRIANQDFISRESFDPFLFCSSLARSLGSRFAPALSLSLPTPTPRERARAKERQLCECGRVFL